MKSKASLDKISLAITSVVILIIVGVAYFSIIEEVYLGAIIGGAVLLIAFLLRPTGYEMIEDAF